MRKVITGHGMSPNSKIATNLCRQIKLFLLTSINMKKMR